MARITLLARGFIVNMVYRNLNPYFALLAVLVNPVAYSANLPQPDPDHDRRGLATFKQTLSRSPAGLLYDTPTVPDSLETGKWQGIVSIGAVGNDGEEPSQLFNEYNDWDSGALFSARVSRQIDALRSLDIDVRELGRDDSSASIRFASTGNYAIEFQRSEIPHQFTADSSAFFSGIGSDYLSLPAGLVPGSNLDTEIDFALQTSGHSDLALKRTRNGLSLTFTPSARVTLTADYTGERREGERPFGGSFLPPFYAAAGAGALVETIEPIDYFTHTFSFAISRTLDQGWYTLSYAGSLFENDNESLTFENPFTNNPASGFIAERGRFALYPDNQSHNLKFDFGRTLGRGQVVASASWMTMRQDEDLLPHTINTGITSAGTDLDDWNTVAALSQSSAEAEIDNLLLHAQVTQALSSRVSFRATLRHEDRDVKTDYSSFNPLTQQFGYVPVDGAYFTDQIFIPGFNTAPFNYRSIPFDSSKTSAIVSIDFRPRAKAVFGIDLERVDLDRENREVQSTNDNKLTLRFSSRAISWATINLSYALSQRDSDRYVADPYGAYFSQSLPGYGPPGGAAPPYFTLDEMRMFDVADRDQSKLKARIRFLIRDNMDLSVQWQREDRDYDAAYGLETESSDNVSIDLNYQPSLASNLYAYWSWMSRDQEQNNIRNRGIGADPTAGGEFFPLDRAWQESADDEAMSFGAGISLSGTNISFTSDVSVANGRTRIDYEYASANALTSPAFASPDQRGVFPNIENESLQWISELKWRLNSNIRLTLFHRFDAGEIDDWHFDGLAERVGNQLYLGTNFSDYAVNTFGITADYSF